MSRKEKVTQIHRFQISLNLLVQAVAVLLIVILVNYFGFNHYKRWDFSRSQKYRLADQTNRILKSLEHPMRVVIFFSPSVAIYEDVVALLKEYQYASKKKIEIEIVDPFRNFSRARELQERYRFGENEDVLILDYDGRTKFLGVNDLADFESSGELLDQTQTVKAFRGEQALSSAILELSEQRQNRVGVLVGQGQATPDDEHLALMRTFIERQNVRVEPVDLTKTASIPEGITTLFILGPKYDLSEREAEIIRRFWEGRGRLFVALDPAAYTPRLTGFLKENGVTPRDDRIVTTMNLGAVTGLVRDVTGFFVSGHKVSKRFAGVNTMFLGGTQSLELARDKSEDLEVDPLIQATDGYWGEVDHQVNLDAGGRVIFEPSRDHSAPLIIAAAVEMEGDGDESGDSRMIVVANGSFFLSDALSQVQPNVDLMLSGMNWLLDREQLIGIAVKPVEKFSMNLTDAQIGTIALITILVMPFCAALFGLWAWAARRR